jgi:hypothetical protein
MPGGDGTGPGGMGPMTGRAAGYCAGYSVPGYANSAWGNGLRAGAVPPGYGPASFGARPRVSVSPFAYGRRSGLGWWGRRGGRGGRGFGRGRGRAIW